MYRGITMQQFKIAERPQLADAELSRSFIQRLIHWGEPAPVQAPSNAEVFDDRDLDQRVRESGEW
jgi:hypothetical protein